MLQLTIRASFVFALTMGVLDTGEGPTRPVTMAASDAVRRVTGQAHVPGSTGLGTARCPSVQAAALVLPSPLPAWDRDAGGRAVYTSLGGPVGTMIVPVGGQSGANFATALQRQQDGRLVVAGYSATPRGNAFMLIRVTADGRLDPSFGRGGTVSTSFGTGPSDDTAHAITVQEDGKLVVVGSTNARGGLDYDLAVARYTADGRLDASFGQGGRIVTPVGASGRADRAAAVRVQRDGKIVVGGTSSTDGRGEDFAVVRYTATGALDATFGQGGRVVTPVGPGASADTVSSVDLQGDGKIVVAGGTFDRATSTGDFAVVRYDARGRLDGAFGSGGKVVTPVGGPRRSSFAKAVTALPDGRIVAAGYTGNALTATGSGYDFAVVRYTAGGALDPTFGTRGLTITPVGPGASVDTLTALQVQSDGNLVAAGHTRAPGRSSTERFALVRYTARGAVDRSFGSDGRVTTSVGGTQASDTVSGLQVQPDGTIVVVGVTGDGRGTTGDVVLARYTAAGRLDPGFGPATGAQSRSGHALDAPVLRARPCVTAGTSGRVM